jgi:hypothetical protein
MTADNSVRTVKIKPKREKVRAYGSSEIRHSRSTVSIIRTAHDKNIAILTSRGTAVLIAY